MSVVHGPFALRRRIGRLECDFCGSSFSVEEVEAAFADKSEEAKLAGDALEASASSSAEAAAGEPPSARGLRLPAVAPAPSTGRGAPCRRGRCRRRRRGRLRHGGLHLPVVRRRVDLRSDDGRHVVSVLRQPHGYPDALQRRVQARLRLALREDEGRGRRGAEIALRGQALPSRHVQRRQPREGDQRSLRAVLAVRRKRVGIGVVRRDALAHVPLGRLPRHGNRPFRRLALGQDLVSGDSVDASTKMPDDYMDSIEPFDYRALTPFSAAYLPATSPTSPMSKSRPAASARTPALGRRWSTACATRSSDTRR